MTGSTGNFTSNKRGFTLIEVLLSVVLIAIIAAFSVPVYMSLQARNDIDVAASNIALALRRGQALSRAVDGDSQWGVKIQVGSITIFKGNSYLTRDTAYDEIYDMLSSITPTGVLEIVFAKATGEPQTSGVINLAAPNNDTRTITINSKGTIDY